VISFYELSLILILNGHKECKKDNDSKLFIPLLSVTLFIEFLSFFSPFPKKVKSILRTEKVTEYVTSGMFTFDTQARLFIFFVLDRLGNKREEKSEKSDNFCVVCQDKDSDNEKSYNTWTTFPCGHSFHHACIYKTLYMSCSGYLNDENAYDYVIESGKCPTCRTNILENKAVSDLLDTHLNIV